ncbi:MAG TPA: MBL fold metallo-hydrolase [Thermoguttaceae bacterium]|nr:MBL fold metallo-hydrolase [Thermoguttaceae bacterium]
MPPLPEVRQYLSSGGTRVYRIACKVLGELTGRVYLVLGAGPATLVDTGSGQGESTRNILDGFNAVRREFGESIRIEQVKRIIITHGHLDHHGGLGELAAMAADAEVYVHPLDGRLITAHEESVALTRLGIRGLLVRSGVPETVGRELLKQPWVVSDAAASPPVEVKPLDGNEIDGLRTIHTPGHSPGHVCLLVDDLLLCGDHILLRTIPQLWPESLRPYKGLGHYLESLELIRGIPGIRLALPGHEPVIEDVYRRIDEIARSQRRRNEKVLDTLAAAERPMTVWEVARTVFQQATGYYASLAFMDAAARVEYLHQRGRLCVVNLAEIEDEPPTAWRYRIVAAGRSGCA